MDEEDIKIKEEPLGFSVDLLQQFHAEFKNKRSISEIYQYLDKQFGAYNNLYQDQSSYSYENFEKKFKLDNIKNEPETSVEQVEILPNDIHHHTVEDHFPYKVPSPSNIKSEINTCEVSDNDSSNKQFVKEEKNIEATESVEIKAEDIIEEPIESPSCSSVIPDRTELINQNIVDTIPKQLVNSNDVKLEEDFIPKSVEILPEDIFQEPIADGNNTENLNDINAESDEGYSNDVTNSNKNNSTKQITKILTIPLQDILQQPNVAFKYGLKHYANPVIKNKEDVKSNTDESSTVSDNFEEETEEEWDDYYTESDDEYSPEDDITDSSTDDEEIFDSDVENEPKTRPEQKKKIYSNKENGPRLYIVYKDIHREHVSSNKPTHSNEKHQKRVQRSVDISRSDILKEANVDNNKARAINSAQIHEEVLNEDVTIVKPKKAPLTEILKFKQSMGSQYRDYVKNNGVPSVSNTFVPIKPKPSTSNTTTTSTTANGTKVNQNIHNYTNIKRNIPNSGTGTNINQNLSNVSINLDRSMLNAMVKDPFFAFYVYLQLKQMYPSLPPPPSPIILPQYLHQMALTQSFPQIDLTKNTNVAGKKSKNLSPVVSNTTNPPSSAQPLIQIDLTESDLTTNVVSTKSKSQNTSTIRSNTDTQSLPSSSCPPSSFITSQPLVQIDLTESDRPQNVASAQSSVCPAPHPILKKHLPQISLIDISSHQDTVGSKSQSNRNVSAVPSISQFSNTINAKSSFCSSFSRSTQSPFQIVISPQSQNASAVSSNNTTEPQDKATVSTASESTWIIDSDCETVKIYSSDSDVNNDSPESDVSETFNFEGVNETTQSDASKESQETSTSKISPSEVNANTNMAQLTKSSELKRLNEILIRKKNKRKACGQKTLITNYQGVPFKLQIHNSRDIDDNKVKTNGTIFIPGEQCTQEKQSQDIDVGPRVPEPPRNLVKDTRNPALSRLPPGLPRLPPGLPRLPPDLPRLPPGLPRLPSGLPRLPSGLPRLPPGLPRLPPSLPRGYQGFGDVVKPTRTVVLPTEDSVPKDTKVHEYEIDLLPKGYICNYCSLESMNRQEIVDHILNSDHVRLKTNPRYSKERKEKKKKKHPTRGKCPYCDLDDVLLVRHYRDVHKKLGFDCKECGVKFKAGAPWKRHMYLRHRPYKEWPFECDLCGKRYVAQKKLNSHRRCVHKKENTNKKYSCGFCVFITASKLHYRSHLTIHLPPEGGVKCPSCDWTGKNEVELKEHKRKNHTNSFQCSECPYNTKCSNSFRLHQIYHKTKKDDEDLNFKCTYCSYKTYRQYNLTVHLLKHKKESEKEYFYCYHCPFKANRKDNLKTHIFKHEVFKRSFKCDICSYETRSKKQLTDHIVKHARNSNATKKI